MEETAQLLKLSISKKAVFRTRLASNLQAIEADAAQIQQVVMNLIINASEALGGNIGDIVVSTGFVDADRAYLSETFLDEHLPEGRSEEHTSELQSHLNLVCRLLLEKKKENNNE